MRYKSNKNSQRDLDFVRTSVAHPRDAKLNIRINSFRKKAAKDFCAEQNISLNNFIDALIAKALNTHGVKSIETKPDSFYGEDWLGE